MSSDHQRFPRSIQQQALGGRNFCARAAAHRSVPSAKQVVPSTHSANELKVITLFRTKWEVLFRLRIA
jgi:hypothetical protein